MKRWARRARRHLAGYLFIAPFLILFTVFVVAPVLIAAGLSFTHFTILQPPEWRGLTNYKLLFMDDDVFLLALRNTMLFAVVAGPTGFIFSFLFAWVIDQLSLRNAFALAFYAPSLTSGVAMSVVWLVFFSPDRYGHINNLLIGWGIMTEPIAWNLDPRTILPVIIFISVWMSMGTGFLVFLAGLQTVPRELYEAAAMDGVRTRAQELWYVTLPQLKPQLLFGSISSIVASFAVFDVATAVSGLPSPDYAGHTIVSHLYDYAFIRFDMGYASAVAVVLFLLTFLLGRVSFRAFSSRGE